MIEPSQLSEQEKPAKAFSVMASEHKSEENPANEIPEAVYLAYENHRNSKRGKAFKYSNTILKCYLLYLNPSSLYGKKLKLKLEGRYENWIRYWVEGQVDEQGKQKEWLMPIASEADGSMLNAFMDIDSQKEEIDLKAERLTLQALYGYAVPIINETFKLLHMKEEEISKGHFQHFLDLRILDLVKHGFDLDYLRYNSILRWHQNTFRQNHYKEHLLFLTERRFKEHCFKIKS